MEFVRLGLVLFLHAYTYIYMINKFFFFIFEILEACDFEEEGGCSPRRGLDSVPILSSARSIEGIRGRCIDRCTRIHLLEIALRWSMPVTCIGSVPSFSISPHVIYHVPC